MGEAHGQCAVAHGARDPLGPSDAIGVVHAHPGERGVGRLSDLPPGAWPQVIGAIEDTARRGARD